jgi:hypothetical protein
MTGMVITDHFHSREKVNQADKIPGFRKSLLEDVGHELG